VSRQNWPGERGDGATKEVTDVPGCTDRRRAGPPRITGKIPWKATHELVDWVYRMPQNFWVVAWENDIRLLPDPFEGSEAGSDVHMDARWDRSGPGSPQVLVQRYGIAGDQMTTHRGVHQDPLEPRCMAGKVDNPNAGRDLLVPPHKLHAIESRHPRRYKAGDPNLVADPLGGNRVNGSPEFLSLHQKAGRMKAVQVIAVIPMQMREDHQGEVVGS
jgi:hypothetical protein